MNISFEYFYRDAANYKNWGRVIFANPGGLDAEAVVSSIREALIDHTYFVAPKVSVPDLHFNDYDEELDHGWHEFFNCTATDEMPNDEKGRAVLQLIESLRSTDL